MADNEYIKQWPLSLSLSDNFSPLINLYFFNYIAAAGDVDFFKICISESYLTFKDCALPTKKNIWNYYHI